MQWNGKLNVKKHDHVHGLQKCTKPTLILTIGLWKTVEKEKLEDKNSYDI